MTDEGISSFHETIGYWPKPPKPLETSAKKNKKDGIRPRGVVTSNEDMENFLAAAFAELAQHSVVIDRCPRLVGEWVERIASGKTLDPDKDMDGELEVFLGLKYYLAGEKQFELLVALYELASGKITPDVFLAAQEKSKKSKKSKKRKK